MSELQDLHAVELDILKAVVALCEKHNLTYSLYCGTLLGAIRHKGFIPWDDDIDLAMPLKDYRRFIKLANELPEPYVMVDWNNCKYYHLPWIKVYADGTTYMEKWEARADMHHGVSLDIYPLIGAYATKKGQMVQDKLLLFARVFHGKYYYRAINDNRWFVKLLKFVPRWIQVLIGKICFLLAVRNPEKSKTVGTIDAAPFAGKYKKTDWDKMTTAEFEGAVFSVPLEFDRILHIIYGDYMKLPPENQRNVHGSPECIIDMHKDYREYRSELIADNSEKYNRKVEKRNNDKRNTEPLSVDSIEDYKKIATDIDQYLINQRFEVQTCVDEKTGLLIHNLETITNYLPVPVNKGDIIKPLTPAPEFCFAFYSKDIPDTLIYTYSYAPESNWATYVPECSDFQFSCLDREIKNDGFIRLVVRGIDQMNKPPRFNELFIIRKAANDEFLMPGWITEEAERNAERVRSVQKPEDAVILLLADTHYATGGNWHFTWESLRLVSDKIHPDALIHLGDFTDGLMPSRHTFGIGAAIIAELNKICSRVFVCIGNHDKNRFRGNIDGISEKDCAELYLGRKKSWYYTDLPEKKLRLLFLDSFSPDKKERYGFSNREVYWLKKVLCFTPKEYKIVVFSHVPPLPEIHVWSDTIRNGEKMIRLLENYNRKHQGAVLGWIHGHNHADQIWPKRDFPIIGIGCSKLESFQEHKPEGSITWPRVKNSPSQELWDVLVVGADNCSMDFIRFGAGEDRRTFNNYKSK